MRWKRTLTVVGVHAEGEYAKVVTGGVVDVPGRTMFDKMQWLAQRDDGLRKFLLYEPRGAAVHSANLILPSRNPKAALGYVIMESTEYPPMSGSNTICTVTAILETGILPMREPETRLTLEAPAGLIEVSCRCEGGRVLQVKFRNVPAFVQHLDAPVEVDGVGTVTLDVAYGGMHYALVDAARLGFAITPDEARDICGLGEKIREAAQRAAPGRAPREFADPGRDDHRVHGTPSPEGPRPDGAEHGRRLARAGWTARPAGRERPPGWP